MDRFMVDDNEGFDVQARAQERPLLRNAPIGPATAFWRIALVRLAPRSESVRPRRCLVIKRERKAEPSGIE